MFGNVLGYANQFGLGVGVQDLSRLACDEVWFIYIHL